MNDKEYHDANGEAMNIHQMIRHEPEWVASRFEALQEENERLREFAESVVQWSKAYPKKIFTEPTPEQIDEVCKESGFRIDRIAGMVLRDFTKPWGIRAQKVLDGE